MYTWEDINMQNLVCNGAQDHPWVMASDAKTQCPLSLSDTWPHMPSGYVISWACIISHRQFQDNSNQVQWDLQSLASPGPSPMCGI